ncbi:hypothetical protein N0V84_000019 [Fusarium piperis]|uniref:Uncharacterized protein n=1 Tax=Fusarium piperis TaxID=1435070 RepID=A0A9W8WPC7_9HYPO|nr:hypothetical protein N0V84_000019 [Fusarium piperis]
MDGTMAAAQSDFLANVGVDDLGLDNIDWGNLTTLNKPIADDVSQGVPGSASVPQQPAAPGFVQLAMGPGPTTGFDPRRPGFRPSDYGINYDNTNNPRPLQINPNYQARPYQPNNIYPDFGLAGRNGPSYAPMDGWFETTDAQGQMQLTPTQVHLPIDDMLNAYRNAPPQPVRGYWRGEDGGHFRAQQPPFGGFHGPAPFPNQPAYQQPARGRELGYTRKRKRDDSPSDVLGRDDEGAQIRWIGGKVQNNRTLKQKGDVACDPTFVYTDPLPPVENWKKRDGGGPHFEYTPLGQWVDHLELTAAELRHYLEHCPRDVNIFVQQPPAQSNCRQQECDRRCRYAGCPVISKIIRPGFVRVAFDEYHDLTSNGLKDPFKVAGCMHLWCFEQCVDPHEFWVKRKLFPDDRTLPKEQKNLMAINRDTDRAIVNKAFLRWMAIQDNQPGLPEIPRDHKDSLTYALVKHHLENQVTARQTCRDRRNRAKAEEDRNTLDLHMGDLNIYGRKCAEVRARKRANAKRRKTASPYEKGLAWVPPRELPRDPELVEQVQEDVFKGSAHSPLSSPNKTQTPVASIFDHYVPDDQEDPDFMQLDESNEMQLDPILMQMTQQTGESSSALPGQSKEPDEYDYMQMIPSVEFDFRVLSPLEQPNSIPQPHPEESTLMQLDPLTVTLPNINQPQLLAIPVQESQSVDATTGSQKRQVSNLEDDDGSLFGDNPRRKRSRGSLAPKSSERQGQGAPLRRSPRQSPRRSAA